MPMTIMRTNQYSVHVVMAHIHTGTSCALTGFVATTLRAGAEDENDLLGVDLRALASVVLSIVPQLVCATTRCVLRRWR
jgi:hypothetical protein